MNNNQKRLRAAEILFGNGEVKISFKAEHIEFESGDDSYNIGLYYSREELDNIKEILLKGAMNNSNMVTSIVKPSVVKEELPKEDPPKKNKSPKYSLFLDSLPVSQYSGNVGFVLDLIYEITGESLATLTKNMGSWGLIERGHYDRVNRYYEKLTNYGCIARMMEAA